PDLNNDWINQRDEKYQYYPQMQESIFKIKKDGIQSNRDRWVYNFSAEFVKKNAEKMIDNYNQELKRLIQVVPDERLDLLNTDEKFISWSRYLKNRLKTSRDIDKDGQIIEVMYYPFVKKHLYFNRAIIEYPREFIDSLNDSENMMISVSGAGTKKGFSAFVT